MFRIWLLACIGLLAVSVSVSGQDAGWTEFRGEQGQGWGVTERLPLNWENDAVRWQIALPGRGWSSPVVVQNQIWVTTAIERESVSSGPREDETPVVSAPAAGLQLEALCVDRYSGALLQRIPLFEIENPPALHSRNSYASPTPVIDGDVVYCSFGTMGTAAIQRQTGEVLWRNDGYEFDHETGPGSSPIVWHDLLILHCDGTDQQFVVALNKTSGQEVWRAERSGTLHENGMMKKAFSTPSVISLGGKDQLISAGANWVYSYAPETGRELWKVPYGKLGFSNVPRPIVVGNVLFACTGYGSPSLMAFQLPTAPTEEPRVLWSYDRNAPTIPSPLWVEGLIYMVSDNGIATCLDSTNGDEVWRERLSGEFAASPIFVDGKILFCNDRGIATWVQPGREFRTLGANRLDSAIMATPACLPEGLIIRTRESLYAIKAIGE